MNLPLLKRIVFLAKKILTFFLKIKIAATGRDMQQMINTHIEASKIGRQIADQVLDYQRRIGDSSCESSPDPEHTIAQMVTVNDPTLASSSLSLEHHQLTQLTSRINGTLPTYSHMRNTTAPSSAGTNTSNEHGNGGGSGSASGGNSNSNNGTGKTINNF